LPVAWIPSLLRDLTGGQKSVAVEGETVRQVIEGLETLFPGIQERLCDGDRLRPSISVVVDGRTSHLKLRQRLEETSEVHFVVVISGGNKAQSAWPGSGKWENEKDGKAIQHNMDR
jgi:molybdopterin converting factor small subunit